MPNQKRSASEIGTLIFGILNIIVVTVSCIILTGLMVYFLTAAISYLHTAHTEASDDGPAAFFIYLQFDTILVLMSLSYIALCFGSFLLNGIIKKKPDHVKVYFVYGIVVTVLSVLACIILLVLTKGLAVKVVVVGLTACFVYSLILTMINFAYRNMAEGTVYQYGHKILVDNEQL